MSEFDIGQTVHDKSAALHVMTEFGAVRSIVRSPRDSGAVTAFVLVRHAMAGHPRDYACGMPWPSTVIGTATARAPRAGCCGPCRLEVAAHRAARAASKAALAAGVDVADDIRLGEARIRKRLRQRAYRRSRGLHLVPEEYL